MLFLCPGKWDGLFLQKPKPQAEFLWGLARLYARLSRSHYEGHGAKQGGTRRGQRGRAVHSVTLRVILTKDAFLGRSRRWITLCIHMCVCLCIVYTVRVLTGRWKPKHSTSFSKQYQKGAKQVMERPSNQIRGSEDVDNGRARPRPRVGGRGEEGVFPKQLVSDVRSSVHGEPSHWPDLAGSRWWWSLRPVTRRVRPRKTKTVEGGRKGVRRNGPSTGTLFIEIYNRSINNKC